MTLCACGCGQEKPTRVREKSYPPSKFIKGHNFKIQKRPIPPWNKGIHTGIISSGMTGKHHDSAWFARMSGANHPNWCGGISFLPYCHKFNNKLKEAVRQRDNYICALCGATQEQLTGKDRKLSIHHIHYDKENCYPDLISLCRSCNTKANGRRKHYESLFINKLNDRELLFWTLSLYKEKDNVIVRTEE